MFRFFTNIMFHICLAITAYTIGYIGGWFIGQFVSAVI